MSVTLECLVLAARNLISADSNGFSDPYVKIRLLDAEGAELGSTQLHHTWKTETIKKNLNPVWGSTMGGRFGAGTWKGEETKAKSIRFSVYDRDLTKSDFLGEAEVSLGDVVKSGEKFDAWLPMQSRKNKTDKVTGVLHVIINYADGKGQAPRETFDTYGTSKKGAMSRAVRGMRQTKVPLAKPIGKGDQNDVVRLGLAGLVVYGLVSILFAFSSKDFLSLRVWGMIVAAAGHALYQNKSSKTKVGKEATSQTKDPMSALRAGEGQLEINIKVRNGSGLAKQAPSPWYSYVVASLNGITHSQAPVSTTNEESVVNPVWHTYFQFFADVGGYPTKREPFIVDLKVIEQGAVLKYPSGTVQIPLMDAWESPNLCKRGWYTVRDKNGQVNGEIFVEATFDIHLKSQTPVTANVDDETVFQYQVINGIKLAAAMADPVWEHGDDDCNMKMHGPSAHDEQNFSLCSPGKNLPQKIGQAGSVVVTDYAPKIFKEIREHFGISTQDYINAWAYDLDELPKPKVGAGRSGSLFLFSKDRKFLYKSIPLHEVQSLLDTLGNYHNHLLTTPNSILMRFVGLLCIHDRVTAQNMFIGVSTNCVWSPLPAKMDELYDLKGRKPKKSEEKQTMKKNSGVWKDNQLRRTFKLGKAQRESLLASIKADSEFLAANNMMDYSLLVGIQEKGDERLATSRALKDLEGHVYYSGHKEVFFIGIIDFLSRYGAKKIAAHFIKSFVWSFDQLSTIDAQSYSQRYISYFPTIFEDNAAAVESDPKDMRQFDAAKEHGDL